MDEEELNPQLTDGSDSDLDDLISEIESLGSDEEEDSSTEEEDRRVTVWIVSILNGVGFVALIGWAVSRGSNEFLSVLSSGTLLGGASFCSGALLGLLFGMPRGFTRKGGTKLENTNLVQISDWLTKALVGAGLTQLHNLGDVLTRIGSTYEHEIHSRGVGIAILIYYTITGFFSGWLVTRFFVEGMLHRLGKYTSGEGAEQKEQNPETKRKQRRKRKSKTVKDPKS